ncbi:LysR family transcriptional regulator (plasmid) [Paracoccus versutus]|uniref:LysR family nitrogen assimilation transcriptional regulator n=1 Tax=Paracoccus versutus TaxID=34007 RepID=A0A3E0BXM2_PARVE|nr:MULTISPECIES: LysR family transcriptional regulator [Paracoccus]KGJ11027.1 hypothetical protein IT40_09390 [Paracoccus versutus]REF72009.1 LysR family nitrogen assimilation transcriptional regulator [Paracoccus versutus]REG47006.1 LysR family nitrogen assimilation transcriptional regulator [Paracoccus versutus]WEJ82221.1 LysR family transcriptional regulator [Paracoccus versutus]WGR55991.1 LysR family transcriptional regulator [Paracoccus versutus]
MTAVDNKPPRLELRQLRYVAMVAECGSITRAAARLGIAQPSLSEALSRLEQDLDTALLVRGKHGVILTEAGATLAETGRQVLDTIDTALEQVQKLGHQSRREIAVGLPMTLTGLMAVPLADSIAHEHPDIRVQITEATTTVLLEQLASGALDLAVCYGGADFDAFAAQPIFEEELFLVAASDNWSESPVIDGLAQKAIAFDRLADLPLVLPAKQNPMRLMLDRLAKAHKCELKPLLELDSLLSLVTFASRASAHIVLSHAAVVKEVANGTLVLVPFREPAPTHTAYLLRRRDRPVSSASLLVERMILSVLAEMIARYRLKARLLKPAGD